MKFEYLEGVRSLGLVGATGLVGQEFLELLSDYKIRIPNLRLLASEDSAGETIEALGGEHIVEKTSADSFDDLEVVFFSATTEVSRRFIPAAEASGAIVIDDSSVYRLQDGVPLVVPEVNAKALRGFEGRIVSIPNCTVTPLVLALKPLLDSFGLKRVVVSTYQSVSGAGKAAYEELTHQTAMLMNGQPDEPSVFPHRIAFNCLPQIGSETENGNTEEEEKLIRETRKILELPDLKISSTAVRVPTFFGHGLSVNVELKDDFGSLDEVRELLDSFPGLKVLDKPSHHIYPTNVEASGSDSTFVGRLRRDHSVASGLNFWVITDNIRKGAALNALQCLDQLFKYRRMA